MDTDKRPSLADMTLRSRQNNKNVLDYLMEVMDLQEVVVWRDETAKWWGGVNINTQQQMARLSHTRRVSSSTTPPRHTTRSLCLWLDRAARLTDRTSSGFADGPTCIACGGTCSQSHGCRKDRESTNGARTSPLAVSRASPPLFTVRAVRQK